MNILSLGIQAPSPSGLGLFSCHEETPAPVWRARGRGNPQVEIEEPEDDPARRLLTVGEYLDERGVTASAARKLAPKFGKLVKALHVQRHGEPPGTSRRFVDGAQREVAVYTEADRDLFDTVWRQLADDQAA